jgi:hypothetical protein
MDSVQIDITLVSSPENRALGLRNPNQAAKDVDILVDVFRAELDYEKDIKIAERSPLPSDPNFVASNDTHESLDDDGLLGLYHSSTSRIAIFLDNCSKVAVHIGQPPDLIARKVLLHELGHLVSHLGVFKGTCSVCSEEASFNWTDFAGSAAELKEHFAQLGTYLAIYDLNSKDLESAMAELSKHQSPRYRSWELHRALALNGVLPFSLKRAFQSQFLSVLQCKPEARQVPTREHMMCVGGYDS